MPASLEYKSNNSTVANILATLSKTEEEKKLPYKTFAVKDMKDTRGNFTIVYLAPEDHVHEKKPSRIVGSDLDDTLVYADSSYKVGHAVPLTETDKIAKLANEDKDSLYVCITARPFTVDQIDPHPLSALSLLQTVKTDRFSLLIFTDKTPKSVALEYLHKEFKVPKDAICLIDDAGTNIVDGDESDFVVIPVCPGAFPTHADYLEEFLTNPNALMLDSRYQDSVRKHLPPASPPPFARPSISSPLGENSIFNLDDETVIDLDPLPPEANHKLLFAL